MEQWQWSSSAKAGPGRRPRVLVEDAGLDPAAVAAWRRADLGVDVDVCSGPARGEVCPMVLDGACPLGTPDVVVCALTSEWRPSVEAGWRQAGVPIAAVDAVVWPAHLGAALALGFSPGPPTDDD